MTSAQHRRTLRVVAIVVLAAIVCDGTSTTLDGSLVTESPTETVALSRSSLSSPITEVAISTNTGEDASLAAESTLVFTPETSSSAFKSLGATMTTFTYEQSFSSDASATGNSSESSGIAPSSTMPSSSTLPVTSVSAGNLEESANSSAGSASTTLGGVPTSFIENGSPATSATEAVRPSTVDSSAFITTSSSYAASKEGVHSTFTFATATTENSTTNAESPTERTSTDEWSSTSSIVPFTSQSNVTSILLTSAFKDGMNSSATVSEASPDLPTTEVSTAFSSKTSISLEASSSVASSTAQNGNILTYSATAESEVTLTTATSVLPNVSSTVTLRGYGAAFTNDAASTVSNEPLALTVKLTSIESVAYSEIAATRLDTAFSTEPSITSTNSQTTSSTTALNVASDDATATAYSSAVQIPSTTETSRTASDLQSSFSDRATIGETVLALNDTASTHSMAMDNSTFQSASRTTDTSAFLNATLLSSGYLEGQSSSELATTTVSNSTTSEVPKQSATGNDSTWSDSEATSAFTTEKGTTPKDMSESTTQVWNVSSTDSSTASYSYTSASSASLRSESNISPSHESASPSNADHVELQSSTSTELSTASSPDTALVSTSISAAHSTSLNSSGFSTVTAPRDLTTLTTSNFSALDQTTAENVSTAQSMPIGSGSQALSGSTATILLSSVSPSPTSSRSMNADASNSSETVLQSSTTVDWVGSGQATFSKASSSASETGVTVVTTYDALSASALSSSLFSAPQSTKSDSDESSVTATSTENFLVNSTSRSILPSATTQRTLEENATASPGEAQAINATGNFPSTSAVPTGVSSSGVNSSEMHSQEPTSVTAPTTVFLAEASTSFGLVSSPGASSSSSSVSHAETAASTREIRSSLLPIFVSVANTSDAVLGTSPSPPVGGDVRSPVASETNVTAEVRTAASEADTSASIMASHMDATLTTVSISTTSTMAVSNVGPGEEQLMSTPSAISATSLGSSIGSSVTTLSQPYSTGWLTSAYLSLAPAIALNQTATAIATDAAAGASSGASTTAEEQRSGSDVPATTATTLVSLSAVTSAATTFLVNDSSATSTAVTYFLSTPTPSTASQSSNSNEASRSTVSNLATSASYFYNTTDLSSISVADHASTRPSRPNFTVEQNERKYGAVVQLTTNMSVDEFKSLRPSLLQELTNLTNSKCNSAPLFPTCCRQSGSRLMNDPWRTYVQDKEVYLGQAQTPLAGQLWFVVAVAPEANNSLCTQGGSSDGSGKNASRSKRDVNLRDENILDPVFLTLIFSNATSEIEHILRNLTNTTVVVNRIDRAEVIVRQLEEAAAAVAVPTPKTSTSMFGESSTSLIAWALPVTFIIAAAILVITVVVAFRRKRCGSAEMRYDRALKSATYSYELQVTP